MTYAEKLDTAECTLDTWLEIPITVEYSWDDDMTEVTAVWVNGKIDIINALDESELQGITTHLDDLLRQDAIDYEQDKADYEYGLWKDSQGALE
jgi:hypothetical protein